MKIAKKVRSQLDGIVQTVLSETRARVNIMKLGELSAAAEAAHLLGSDVKAAVLEKVNAIRED